MFGAGYKIVPLTLLILYSLCIVCPDRLAVSATQPQQVTAGETEDPCDHDNHDGSAYQCRQLSSEYLPSQKIKASPEIAVQPGMLLPHRNLLVGVGLPCLLAPTHPPNLIPASAPLLTKLRI
jgi:hypothetical protein